MLNVLLLRKRETAPEYWVVYSFVWATKNLVSTFVMLTFSPFYACGAQVYATVNFTKHIYSI